MFSQQHQTHWEGAEEHFATSDLLGGDEEHFATSDLLGEGGAEEHFATSDLLGAHWV